MFFLMLITLYTSRITLQVLGVEDFGIYNIVGGVVVLFAFLARSLNSASSRYLSVAVGSGDGNEIQKTFSTALVAHIFLLLIVFLILETFGLWFVVYKLNIPEGREIATYTVYQFAILSTCLNIIRIPFNASIIANEQMSFYAYMSIAEGVLKLVVVWVLLIIASDKLVNYSIMMMLIIAMINICYILYCNRKFIGNRFVLKTDKAHLIPMLKFSGWNLFGGIADLGWQQGTNIILNMFYGVTLNATMGITNQVRTAVYSFVINLQTAATPQIIKSYNNKDLPRYHSLINTISRYSYYLMLLFAIPLIANMDFILHLWLKNPPPSSTEFCNIIILFSTLGALGGPLWMSIQATGDVKKYSIVVSCFLLLNLPATYLLFKFNYAPESMLWARIVIGELCDFWVLYYVSQKVNHSIITYFKDVILPVTLVTIITSVPIFYLYLNMDKGWNMVITSTMISTMILLLSIYSIGIKHSERILINNYIKGKICKTININI